MALWSFPFLCLCGVEIFDPLDLFCSVYAAGGNLTTGKMIKLGGEFAVMMHIECPHEKVSDLRADLHSTVVAGSLHGGPNPLAGCDVHTRQVVALGAASETEAPAFTGGALG